MVDDIRLCDKMPGISSHFDHTLGRHVDGSAGAEVRGGIGLLSCQHHKTTLSRNHSAFDSLAMQTTCRRVFVASAFSSRP